MTTVEDALAELNRQKNLTTSDERLRMQVDCLSTALRKIALGKIGRNAMRKIAADALGKVP